MSEPPKEELKIKDLLIKLQVLSNGLIEERKKSQSYLDRIKEYESSLQKKDAEIVDLTKEKFDLKSKLSLEKSKANSSQKNDSFFSGFFSKKPPDTAKVAKLEEAINQQNLEIKELTQKLMEGKELFDQDKIKFQTMMTLQTQQMTELKKNLETAKKEVPKVKEVPPDNKEKLEALNRKFNLVREDYERKLNEYKTELNEEKEKEQNLDKKLNEYKDSYESKSIENKAMSNQIGILSNQVKQLKEELQNKQLSPRMFQVERIKDGVLKNKKVMTVTFQWNKHKNICEIVFKRMKHGGEVKEDIVNIIDISKFKVNDKKKELIDIVFTVSIILIDYNIFLL